MTASSNLPDGYADGGITIWDRMPHPAQSQVAGGRTDDHIVALSRKRQYVEANDTLDVAVGEGFWRRIGEHCRGNPRQWNALLGEEGTRELMSLRQLPGAKAPGFANPLVRPVVAEKRLKESLRAALRQPCVMIQRRTADGLVTWHVVLREGAMIVLTFDNHRARAMDCFFPPNSGQTQNPRQRQMRAVMTLVIRFAKIKPGSRQIIIQHAPPGGRVGETSSPATWFLASPALLPAPTISMKTVIQIRHATGGHSAPEVGGVKGKQQVEDVDASEAYDVLIAFGQSILFGFDDERASQATRLNGGTPTVEVALLATVMLVDHLREWEGETSDLPKQWTDASDAYRNELRYRTIERRTEAWAACLALDATYEGALNEASPKCDELARAIDRVLDGVDAFDRAIEVNVMLLLSAWSADDRERWRNMIAAEYREAQLPWLVCDQS